MRFRVARHPQVEPVGMADLARCSRMAGSAQCFRTAVRSGSRSRMWAVRTLAAVLARRTRRHSQERLPT